MSDASSLLLFAGFAGFSLLLSLVALLLAFNRYFSYSEALGAQVVRLFSSGDRARAERLCKAAPPKTIISRLYARAIKSANEAAPETPPEALLRALQQATRAERELLQRDTLHLQLLQALSLLWLLIATCFAIGQDLPRDPSGGVVVLGALVWYVGVRLEKVTTLHEKLHLPPLLRALANIPNPSLPPTPRPVSTTRTITFQLFRGEERLPEVSFPRAPQTIKLGRARESDTNTDISLSGDNIARLHAVIEIQRDRLFVIDLGADLGTQVNQQKITKAELLPGDIITIGDNKIIYTEA